MRDSIALGGMRVSDVAGGFEVSNHPVKMWFIRKCGTKIDYSKKDEKCECMKCSPTEDWVEFMAWIDERRKTIFDVRDSCKCTPIVVCDECILQEERGWEDCIKKEDEEE